MTTRQDVDLDRTAAQDILAAAVVTGLALVGFRPVYTGAGWLVAGFGGIVLAAILAALIVRFRVPGWAALGISVVVWIVAGAGLAVPHTAGAGFLPTPAAISALLDGAVHGWSRVITTVPPVGNDGHLLVLPYLSGFASTLLAALAAIKMPRSPLYVVFPLAVLVASVLLGVRHPVSIALQGSAFLVVATGWLALHGARRRPIIVHTSAGRRLAGAAAMLVVVGVGSSILSPVLPFASAHPRYVLRDHVTPPFDPRLYPSPLVGYRNYVAPTGDNNVILKVTGLPAGDTVRLATLDSYDGLTWSAGSNGGLFAHTGHRVGTVTGGQTQVGISLLSQDGPWLPIPSGDVSAITFSGTNATQLGSALRFNRSTQTAAVPLPITAADNYSVSVHNTPVDTARAQNAALDTSVGAAASALNAQLPAELRAKIANIAGTGKPYQEAKRLEVHFRQGLYSDGGEGTGVPPGHGLFRLVSLMNSSAPAGDAEQYAAAMAFAARSLGMPARVVMGFTAKGASPTTTVDVHRKDVDAWVEIAFRGVGWVAFHPTPDKSRTPQPKPKPKPKTPQTLNQVLPPPPAPPIVPPDKQPNRAKSQRTPHKKGSSFDFAGLVTTAGLAVGVPLLVIGGPIVVILALKERRRRRRRRTGPPASRISNAWREAIDTLTDAGHRIRPGLTRRETAAAIALPGLSDLAVVTDEAVFARADPTENQAAAIWTRVDALRGAVRREMPPRQRFQHSLSLASFRMRKGR